MTDKALAARLREHANLHREHLPQDHEQQQWTADLYRAADLIDQMLAYGRDCERAAYERAAQECREQAKFHAVHRDYRYDFKADGANECASAIEALGADK